MDSALRLGWVYAVNCFFERESKESILPRFDLVLIARYFPEFDREIKRRL